MSLLDTSPNESLLKEAQQAAADLKFNVKENALEYEDKIGAPDKIRALVKFLSEAKTYVENSSVSEGDKREFLRKSGKILNLLDGMGAEYTSLKSDIVADTATQINAIKGSYTTLRNHQIAQYSIGKVDVKPVFNGSNPKELAAFLADGNDSKEIEYTTDDIFTEYELYRALSRRTIDQIKTSFKEVTGKDFNPSDEGQAKNLRKEFLRVLFYKANMFRTLEPILEGKLPKYITELQKEVKKETEKNVMNAQEIASNPDFKIIMQKLESTLGAKPNVQEMALQFVNEMSRNNVAIMLNPQQISSTLASMAQQPVNTWLTQTSKGLLGISFSHTFANGVSAGLTNFFVPFIGYSKDIAISEVKDLPIAGATTKSIRPEIQFMPGVVYTGVAVQFKDKIAEIDAKTQLLQTELLKCITEDGIDPTQTTQSEIKPILENIRQWFTGMNLTPNEKPLVLQAIAAGFVNRYRHELMQNNSGWSATGVSIGVFHVLGVLKLPGISLLGQKVASKITLTDPNSPYVRAAKTALGDTTENQASIELVTGNHRDGYTIHEKAIVPEKLPSGVVFDSKTRKLSSPHPLTFTNTGAVLSIASQAETTNSAIVAPPVNSVGLTTAADTQQEGFEKKATQLISRVQHLSSAAIRNNPSVLSAQKSAGLALEDGNFATAINTIGSIKISGKPLFSPQDIASIHSTSGNQEIFVRSFLMATMGSQDYRNFVNGKSTKSPKNFNHNSTATLRDSGIVSSDDMNGLASEIATVRDASKSAYEAAVKKSVDEKSPMPFKRIEGVIGFTNIDQIKSDRQGNTVPHFKKIQAIPGSFDATDLGEFTTQEIPNSDALRKGLIEKIPDRTLMLYQAQLKLASIADVKKVFNGEKDIKNTSGETIACTTKVLYARLLNCGNDSYLLEPKFTINSTPKQVNLTHNIPNPITPYTGPVTPVGTTSGDATQASFGVLGNAFGSHRPTPVAPNTTANAVVSNAPVTAPVTAQSGVSTQSVAAPPPVVPPTASGSNMGNLLSQIRPK